MFDTMSMSIVCGRGVAMLAGGLQRQNRVSVGLCSAPLRCGMEARVPSHSYVGLRKKKISPLAQDEGVAKAVPVDVLYEIAEGLETSVQLVYLTTLLGFLVVGAYFVVRQVLFKREMEEAAKVLGERVRNQEATAEDYYELGVILLRKKLFTQANSNLKKALKDWDEDEGDEEVLAQVYNALGYSYFNLDRVEDAIKQYTKAVELQPGYLTAWNNLGDVLEKQKRYGEALSAYQEVLGLDPGNTVAKERAAYCKTRVDRTQGIM
jgi:tetratricopeptide (TPR) repeat protein